MPRGVRSHARTCSKPCRQALHRFKIEPAPRAAGTTVSRRFGYADPPYPGCAQRYYKRAEVDHRDLVARLMREFPDGWALSTSAEALDQVLAFCPRGTRVCPWVRGSRRVKTKTARRAWEPLLVYGGRQRVISKGEELDDVLLLGIASRQRLHPNALTGMKPAPFWEWMFRLLGALPGDDFVELFPGSGAGARAWKLFTTRREPPRGATFAVRMQPRPRRGLAGAARRLCAQLELAR